MDCRRKRHSLVRIVIREIAFAVADRLAVAGDVQVINVFEQVGDEEEGVDFVLMLGGLCELVLLVGARLEASRVVLTEVPRAQRGLR